jgi:hypothetical protein
MNLHSFPTQQRGARRRTDANKRGESRHPEAGGGFVGWTDKASRSGRGVSGGQGAISGGANGGEPDGLPARWWMPESRRWGVRREGEKEGAWMRSGSGLKCDKFLAISYCHCTIKVTVFEGTYVSWPHGLGDGVPQHSESIFNTDSADSPSSFLLFQSIFKPRFLFLRCPFCRLPRRSLYHVIV